MATAHFNEENSADIVTGQNANAKDERLRQVMDVITRHLHAAVKEIEPTQEEWMQAIQFLTATGHKCDDWRQEYILLSDVLGVSMLVDAINSRRPAGASENTVLGPFHIGGTPEYEMGTNICLDGKGEDMVVRGRVLDIDGDTFGDPGDSRVAGRDDQPAAFGALPDRPGQRVLASAAAENEDIHRPSPFSAARLA